MSAHSIKKNPGFPLLFLLSSIRQNILTPSPFLEHSNRLKCTLAPPPFLGPSDYISFSAQRRLYSNCACIPPKRPFSKVDHIVYYYYMYKCYGLSTMTVASALARDISCKEKAFSEPCDWRVASIANTPKLVGITLCLKKKQKTCM